MSEEDSQEHGVDLNDDDSLSDESNELTSTTEDGMDYSSGKKSEPDDRTISRRDFLKTVGTTAGAAAAAPLLLGKGSVNRVFAQTSDPVRIGVLLPYSGIYAQLGESITEAMELYFDQIGWEAGGREIELVREDSEMDPGVALTRARRLIEQRQVDLLTGVVSGGVLQAVGEYVSARQKLLLVSTSAVNAFSRGGKSPYIWRTSWTSWQPNYPLSSWLANNVGTEGLISVHDYVAGHEMGGALQSGYVNEGGEIVHVQMPTFPEMGDTAPYMSRIQDVDPDVVMTFFAGSAAVSFVNAYDEFGLHDVAQLSGSGFLTGEDVLPAQGDSAEGIITGLHWAWGLDTPANVEFRERIQNETDRIANVYSVQGFDTARVIHEMLDEVGGDTDNVDNMTSVLPEISFTSPRGPFTLDEETQNPDQHIYIREVREIDDGTYRNFVIEDTGSWVDPGDDSMEVVPPEETV